MLHKHLVGGVLSTLALVISAQALAGTVTSDGADLVIKTKGGLEVATTDKAFAFKLGGKLQWDATQFDGLMAASQNKPFDDTFNTFIRRGEIGMEGIAYTDWDWGLRLSYDDSADGSETTVDRAFIAWNGLPDTALTIGRFGVDYGLENSTSSSWITAIERPFMYDFLNGDEDTKFGVNAKYYGDNFSLMGQVATFDDGHHETDGNNERFGYTFRAHWAPYLKGNDVVHVAANYHNSNADDDRSRVRTRMGVRSDEDMRVTFADVSSTDKDSEFVLEGAAQFGGVRAQTEYFQRTISGENSSKNKADVDINGYNAQLSYMFGTQRGYKGSAGYWDKPVDMKGTWEIFARYESTTVDGDDGAIPGNLGVADLVAKDRGDEFTASAMVVGANYFATPAIRLSLNYVDYQVDNINTQREIKGNRVEDDGKAIIGRLQYVF